jgi:hypothetical protein
MLKPVVHRKVSYCIGCTTKPVQELNGLCAYLSYWSDDAVICEQGGRSG